MKRAERESALEPDPVREHFSDRIFELTLDALPDGVLVVNAERRVVYANTAFMDHWSLPHELRGHGNEKALLHNASTQLTDPGSFLCNVEALYASNAASQDGLHLKDGRILARRSIPLVTDHISEARVWIFTDVTTARHALLDPLSGVPNRRAFAQEFPRLAEGFCDGLLKCIAILDIDNFKTYNDLYGHAAGDDVLRRVGAILRAQLARNDDYIFRIGGEEFLLGCRSRHESETAHIIDGIRAAIASAEIKHAGNPPHGIVTSSIGFVTFHGSHPANVIFDSADGALYRAKAEGRNTIRQAEPVES